MGLFFIQYFAVLFLQAGILFIIVFGGNAEEVFIQPIKGGIVVERTFFRYLSGGHT